MKLRLGSLLLVALLALPAAAAEPRPLRIVVDPGHGGLQTGAVGPGKVLEKDIALAIARKLSRRLREGLTAQVLMTRDKDEQVALRARTELANAHAADLLVSVHLNSMPTRRGRNEMRGFETYFLSADPSSERASRVAAMENADGTGVKRKAKGDLDAILGDLTSTAAHQDSVRLAEAIQRELGSRLTSPDHGIHQAPLTVLEGATMPAVLCEVGFISHPEEGAKLATDDYQEAVAEGLFRGIERFLAELKARDTKR